MIQVRETFIAKPGCASKLARMFVEALRSAPWRTRVLTDVVGQFNTVCLETEAASTAEFEARMQEYMSNAELRNKMAGYTELYVEGKREIFQVVE